MLDCRTAFKFAAVGYRLNTRKARLHRHRANSSSSLHQRTERRRGVRPDCGMEHLAARKISRFKYSPNHSGANLLDQLVGYHWDIVI